MEYKINGDNLEVLSLEIGGKEMVYGEAGSMSYMSGNVVMNTEASGGFMKGLKRKFSGESFFVTQFTTAGGTGIVAFSGQAPGRIVPLELQPGVEYIA